VSAKIVDEVITDYKGEAKEPSLLKWVIASAALLVFIVLLLFFLSNKSLILSRAGYLFSRSKSAPVSKVENPDPSRTAVGDPIKEQMRPLVDQPRVSQTEEGPSAKP
jgi:hypothetical protein